MAVNDALALTGTQATLGNGTEDTAYTINTSDLLTGFTDVDGDSLSVANLTVTNGTLTDNNNSTYTLNPTADYNGIVNLGYNVIDGQGGTVAATNSFNLAVVNDLPTVSSTVQFLSTQQGILPVIPTVFTAKYNDLETPNLVKVKITTLPSNGVLALNNVAITQNQEIQAANLAKLTYTANAGFSGTNTFIWKGSDGTGYSLDSATVQIDVLSTRPSNDSVLKGMTSAIKQANVIALKLSFTRNTSESSGTDYSNVYTIVTAISLAIPSYSNSHSNFELFSTLRAKGFDGPISEATVFFDANLNGVQDTDEPFTATDSTGNYQLAISNEFDTNGNGTIELSEGIYVLVGGTDAITGQSFTGTMKATPGSTVITPLTNLITELVQTGLTPTEAETKVENALGLPSGIDLSTFDSLEAAQTGFADGLKILAAQVVVQTLITQLSQSIQTISPGLETNTIGDTVGKALTNAIQTGSLDLSNTTQVEGLLNSTVNTLMTNDNTLDLTTITNNSAQLAQVAAASNEQILTATNAGGIFQAQTVAQGSTTSDLKSALNAPQTFANVVTNNTGTNLTTKVAAATTPFPLKKYTFRLRQKCVLKF